MQYKGIYAGVFFQGVDKTSVNLKANTSYFVPFANGKDQSSARVQAADHWRASDPNNMNVLYPRLHTNEYSNNTLNTGLLAAQQPCRPRAGAPQWMEQPPAHATGTTVHTSA